MGGGEAQVRAEYITRAGVQEYESLGWMSGHEVHYTIPAGVKVLALKYRETGYDTEFDGSFTCDDPYFNSLWEKAHRTLYVNMRDTYFDCPDRERAQWWGDLVIDLGEAFYVLDRKSDLLAKKALIELVNWQKDDGALFSPSPAGNWDKELPTQMLASVGWYGAWLYYHNTGDLETIQYCYPHIRRYLDLWKLGTDGLVVHRAGGWDWEDWGENIDAPLLDNAWYVLAMKAAIAMAKITGNQADVAGYQRRSIVSQTITTRPSGRATNTARRATRATPTTAEMRWPCWQVWRRRIGTMRSARCFESITMPARTWKSMCLRRCTSFTTPTARASE